jgi:hypothetical protein
MNIIEVTPDIYFDIIHDPYFAYAGKGFNDYNSKKYEKIYYLIFKDNKHRLGMIGGKVGDIFCSPFSAPFGGFVFFKDSVGLGYIDQAIDLFLDWAKKYGFLQVKITLPPMIYNEKFISKVINSLHRKKFYIEKVDLNYSFLLEGFDVSYLAKIQHSARKNLKKALSSNLTFHHCISLSDKYVAYEIIKINRDSKDYVLRMSVDDTLNTGNILGSDYFLIYDYKNEPIASAIVFHVTSEIVQVVYWGGLPGYNHLRAVNFMAYKIFEYYKNKKIRIVDIGPSTDSSIPNYGLCEFKENIGCNVTNKISLLKDL